MLALLPHRQPKLTMGGCLRFFTLWAKRDKRKATDETWNKSCRSSWFLARCIFRRCVVDFYGENRFGSWYLEQLMLWLNLCCFDGLLSHSSGQTEAIQASDGFLNLWMSRACMRIKWTANIKGSLFPLRNQNISPIEIRFSLRSAGFCNDVLDFFKPVVT